MCFLVSQTLIEKFFSLCNILWKIVLSLCLCIDRHKSGNPEKKTPMKAQNIKTTQPRKDSRTTMKPIDGCEMPFTNVEQSHHRQYHSANNLSTTISNSAYSKPSIDGHIGKSKLTAAIKRSNTIAASSNPPLIVQPRRYATIHTSKVKVKPPVAKKPTTKGPMTTTTQQQEQNSTTSQHNQKPITTATDTPGGANRSNSSNHLKTKKSWTHHKRDNYNVELNDLSKRLSLSLETVDEISELEESMNLSHNSANASIHRLIAKFQTKIEEVERVAELPPRLNSVDSVLSSVGDDNDSVFTDNEELATNVKNNNSENKKAINSASLGSTSDRNSIASDLENDKITQEQDHNNSKPCNGTDTNHQSQIQQSLKHNTKKEDNSTANGYRKEDNFTANGYEKADNFIANGEDDSIDLSTIDQLTSSFAESCATDNSSTLDESLLEPPVAYDSLLEPPLSFSSPAVSETATDVTPDEAADTDQSHHCCCCVHYQQSNQSSASSELQLLTGGDNLSESASALNHLPADSTANATET